MHSMHACSKCTLQFSSAELLSKHTMVIHFVPAPASNTSYPCSTCSAVFRSQMAANQHSEAKHPAAKNPTCTCTICSRAFLSLEVLQEHTKISHPPDYPCSKCTVKFTTDSALEEHLLKSHSRFKCLTCDLPYASQSDLDEHYRIFAVHPNCDKCGKGYLNDESLLSVRQSFLRYFSPTDFVVDIMVA